jgi:hypothetical protein
MDDLSGVEDLRVDEFVVSADRLREMIRVAQRIGHANALLQRVFFSDPGGEEKEVMCITDLYDERWPTKTVTNDAEFVLSTMRSRIVNIPVIYRDSEGNWDELRHREGYFATFRPLNTRDRGEAIQRVLAFHG